MIDPYDLNSLECLNNGKCVVNISSNTTYCQCDPCHKGVLCETDIFLQIQFDETYVFLIRYLFGLCLAIVNNGLVLELFICCRRIRNTNCGIYLMVYSILSLVSNILVVVHQTVKYYPNQLVIDVDQYITFRCYVDKLGYHVLVTFCIVLSACMAFERGLIICFEGKMNSNRWRSCVLILFIFGIGVGSAMPLFIYKCNWNYMPNLQIARNFLSWFWIAASIAVYLLATLLVLISFARRIHRYGMENGSYIKTFLKLLNTHLFIFVPPISYAISTIPYTIVYYKSSRGEYYQCGISTVELIIKVLLEASEDVPYAVTWLLFIYPSRVYMTEFYLHTWSGQRLAKILLFFKSCKNREKSNHLSTTNLISNEHNNKELTV